MKLFSQFKFLLDPISRYASGDWWTECDMQPIIIDKKRSRTVKGKDGITYLSDEKWEIESEEQE